MKTPKRKPPYREFCPHFYNEDAVRAQRWKRKNRISQYKRTIARLTQELQRERERCSFLHAAYASLAEFARNAKQNMPHLQELRVLRADQRMLGRENTKTSGACLKMPLL